MSVSIRLVTAWKNVLEMCKVLPEESLVFLVAEHSNPEHVEASRLAALMIGVRFTSIQLGEYNQSMMRVAGELTGSKGATNLSGNSVALTALRAADIVIDFMGIDKGREQVEILSAGTRILLVKEPPDVFLRLLPSREDRERALAAANQLRGAKTMHVTSPAGTDIRFELGQYELLVQYGLADEPGRWDHCPSTFVATWPNEGSSNGIIVFDEGTTILPFKEYVRTPIFLSIEGGYIRSIEGGLDARYLRDYMEKFNDPEGYAVSHIGWGLQKRAHWTSLGLYDKRQSNANEARSFFGNFMFSVGPNLEGGGTRDTQCHLDIPMLDCSVSLDGQPVTIDQVVVERN